VLSAIRHLDYVVLLCRDIQRMKAFYRDVMGFPVDAESDTWIELRVGSVILALRHRTRDYDGAAAPAGSAHLQLAFRVTPSQVDSCHTELVERQVEILEPPVTQSWGHRTLFFRDPENNVLEIYADV
jgi:catechol 2,3-dioxygenase-like lactoylglutathione lyase family enzyme